MPGSEFGSVFQEGISPSGVLQGLPGFLEVILSPSEKAATHKAWNSQVNGGGLHWVFLVHFQIAQGHR